MKKLALIIGFVVSVFAFAQVDEEYVFADISWLSSPATVVSSMTSEGFTTEDTTPTGEVGNMTFNGRLLGKDAVAFAQFDNSDQLIRMRVYLLTGNVPRASKFSTAETTYNTMKEILTNSYGEPDSSAERFIDPYFRGDGYETLAAEEDKALFTSIWENATAGGIVLDIDTDVDVGIIYESSLWGQFLDNRDAEDSDIF